MDPHAPQPAAGSEAIARHVLDNLMEGCQVVGFDFRYLYVNDAVVVHAHLSREELLGRTMMECYPGIDGTPMFETLRRCMTERRHDRMENEFTYPDGSRGWFELRFVPVPEGVCVLSLDVTPSKRAAEALAHSEEQLRQAQKMEAVGRLAGGVAHDFNNVLSIILSYAGLIGDALQRGDPLRADVDEIRKAGERAAELTRQLLALGRQQVLTPRVLHLGEILAGMKRMIGRMVGESIDVRIATDADLGRVKADPAHLEQVLLNLVANARDAMPDGGTLTLEARNTDLDAGYAAQHLGVIPGPHVMLIVSDTGTGMDAATREHLFEPFFTTKPKGKGTGLGLSTVFGIVRQNGGHVWVYSEPGKGTTFKIYLPRTDEVPRAEEPAPPTTSLHGTETILLVEDDDALRAVAGGILARNGYQVVEARNGGEALLACERQQGAIHLLLTDVVMPHMSGRQLVERLAPLRPDMRVLYMSGYTEEAIVHHRLLGPGIALLPKPITPDLLLRKVRQVLDAPIAPRES